MDGSDNDSASNSDSDDSASSDGEERDAEGARKRGQWVFRFIGLGLRGKP